jgi:hypothetical protein
VARNKAPYTLHYSPASCHCRCIVHAAASRRAALWIWAGVVCVRAAFGCKSRVGGGGADAAAERSRRRMTNAASRRVASLEFRRCEARPPTDEATNGGGTLWLSSTRAAELLEP